MPRYDSDSDSSYRSRSRRKKKKVTKRNRRSSSSSSSSSSVEKSSSSEKSKPRRYHRSRSRNRSKQRHESSHSKRHHKKTRSSSSSGSSSSSRTRSRKHSNRGKHKSQRSKSKGDSRSRTSKTSRQSKSPSLKKSKLSKTKNLETDVKQLNEKEIMREKLQAALKAAAEADAQLRQKGLLAETFSQISDGKASELTIADQIKRAEAIDEINSSAFTQQEFTSARSWGKRSSKVSAENGGQETENMQEPAAGANSTTLCENLEGWRECPEKLAHPNLSEDLDIRIDRWKKKLHEMRKKRWNLNERI